MTNEKREFYQVVTKDRQHFFSEHTTMEKAVEHIASLLSGSAPHSNFEYEILFVTETRKEVTINYPVYL